MHGINTFSIIIFGIDIKERSIEWKEGSDESKTALLGIKPILRYKILSNSYHV